MVEKISAWLAKPYDESGSALNWFLFIGLLVAISIFWNFVLLEIVDGD